MNAKLVLSKIASILNLSDDTPIQAKTADGKIFQSSNFDVNDDVFEVGEDGKLTPATDGEYTITFTTPEGEESTQVIDIDGGKVAEISTPDEESDEETGTPEEKEEETDMDDIAAPPTPSITDVTMAAEDLVSKPKGPETKKAKALPYTTDEDKANEVNTPLGDKGDDLLALSYRITELESKIGDLTNRLDIAHKEAQSTNIEDDVKFDDVPKLDGAPVEMSTNFSAALKPNNNKKEGNSQSSFLSKLYNK
jgi:hypothetical protein